MGLQSMCGYTGGFLGPLGVGLALDLAGDNVTNGWGVGFGHLAVVTLAGLFVLRWLGRAKEEAKLRVADDIALLEGRVLRAKRAERAPA